MKSAYFDSLKRLYVIYVIFASGNCFHHLREMIEAFNFDKMRRKGTRPEVPAAPPPLPTR